jgi:hypothetical protein
MAKPTFTPPDSRNWTFLGVGDRPIVKSEAPQAAHLPMTEIARIIAMVAYINQQIAACDAVRAAPP